MAVDLPTPDQLAFARSTLEARRLVAMTALLTGEVRETVAAEVFSFVEGEDMPTAGDVADRILRYVAVTIEPLMALPKEVSDG